MHDIPEEAVKAVIGVPVSGPYLSKAEAVEIIEAAHPFLPVQVAVKKLEWRTVVENGRDIQSFSPLGKYVISIDDAPAGGTHYLWVAGQPDSSDYHSSYQNMFEAKAAAQADYSARILSALETSAGRASVLEEGYRQGIEAAAQIIETKQEGFQVRGGGRVLIDRSEGDQSGLGYAAAIRALASHPVADKPDEAGAHGEVTAATHDVLAERRRQIEAEGWTEEHDDSHSKGEMLTAAWCYMQRHADKDMFGDNYDINKLPPPARWPWSKKWWKPSKRRRDLVKAGALILAEIERLDRLATHPSGGDRHGE